MDATLTQLLQEIYDLHQVIAGLKNENESLAKQSVVTNLEDTVKKNGKN